MKLLPEMLAEWVRTDLSPGAIGDLLTMTGFELEEILEVEGAPVLDVNIMANRGDGASVLGLAREVNAKVGGATELFTQSRQRFHGGDHDTARIDIGGEPCDRFALLDVPEAHNGPSPEWLQSRLRRMGQRPISLLVDLTNYVMLEVGQPLHAYDADRLTTGRFLVRAARSGEKLTTLDGIERTMRGGETLVCEGEGEGRPVALAGVMGGADTEVHAGTKRAVIEAAHFGAQSVRATRKAHGLFTEASYRFERAVDFFLPSLAFDRFVHLYRSITGSQIPYDAFADVDTGVPSRSPLGIRPERASRLLGYSVDGATCRTILNSLGFEDYTILPQLRRGTRETEAQRMMDEGYVVVESAEWRYDVKTETDLVEEVGRIHGYEKIPSLLPQGTTRPGGRQGYEAWRERVLEAAIAEGFSQTIGHSLVPEDPFEVRGGRIGPRVPASPEHRYLRSSLWTSLGMSARRNGGRDLSLFEIGKTFYGAVEGGGLEFSQESDAFAILSEGALNPPGLKSAAGERADFFTVKGSLERILAAAGVAAEFSPSDDARLHPTRQAAIVAVEGERYRIAPESAGGMERIEEERSLGVLGQIHPRVAEEAGLSPETVLASLDLRAVYEASGGERPFRRIARTPPIRRDLAIVAPKSLPYREIERVVLAACGELLERRWVFDVYEGPNLPEGTRSVGVAIELRKAGATFTDEEANRVRETIEAGLREIGATLRV